MRGDDVLHASILFVCMTILLILPAVYALKVLSSGGQMTEKCSISGTHPWLADSGR